jgi:hypothetical protein
VLRTEMNDMLALIFVVGLAGLSAVIGPLLVWLGLSSLWFGYRMRRRLPVLLGQATEKSDLFEGTLQGHGTATVTGPASHLPALWYQFEVEQAYRVSGQSLNSKWRQRLEETSRVETVHLEDGTERRLVIPMAPVRVVAKEVPWSEEQSLDLLPAGWAKRFKPDEDQGILSGITMFNRYRWRELRLEPGAHVTVRGAVQLRRDGLWMGDSAPIFVHAGTYGDFLGGLRTSGLQSLAWGLPTVALAVTLIGWLVQHHG